VIISQNLKVFVFKRNQLLPLFLRNKSKKGHARTAVFVAETLKMLGWLMEIILLIQLVPAQEILLKVRYLKELLVTTLGQNLAMVDRLNSKLKMPFRVEMI